MVTSCWVGFMTCIACGICEVYILFPVSSVRLYCSLELSVYPCRWLKL